MLHKGFTVKTKLQKMKWLSMSSGNAHLPSFFGAWFQAEFNYFFTAPLSWKGPLLEDTWMIKDSRKFYGAELGCLSLGFCGNPHIKLLVMKSHPLLAWGEGNCGFYTGIG